MTICRIRGLGDAPVTKREDNFSIFRRKIPIKVIVFSNPILYNNGISWDFACNGGATDISQAAFASVFAYKNVAFASRKEDIILKKGFIRRMALLLSAAVILGVAAGCAPSGDKVKLDPNKPTTIVIWHYYHEAQKTALDNAVKQFNETLGYEKGIIVEAVSTGGVNELAENVLAAAKGELDAGEMPNIFGSYGDTALEIVNMGKAAYIDDYLTEDELAEYRGDFIREGRIGTENLYVFPIAKSSESLMLNKTDFDAFVEGLQSTDFAEPVSYEDLSTWEGILRVADLYYRYTESAFGEGKALLGIDGLANYLIVGSKQLGQDLVTVENGKAASHLDKDVMSKLWYTYYEPMVTGRFAKLGRFCSDDIKTGDSLCFVGSTSSGSYFPTELTLDDDTVKEIELLVLPMPVFEGADKVAISQGAGMVIAKSTKEQEYASAIFLKWFTQAEMNVPFSLMATYMPVKNEALDDALLNSVFDAVDADDVAAQNSVKALKVGIEQLRSYTLYSSEVFDGGMAFRNLLPVALEAAVQQDRFAYLEAIAAGADESQAYAALLQNADLQLDAWIASLAL